MRNLWLMAWAAWHHRARYVSWLLTFMWLMSAPVFASLVANISGFVTQTDGNIIYAATWNSQIGAIYNYINENLVPVLNTIQNKGDLLTTNGSSFVNLPAGANGQALFANSSSPTGLLWASAASIASLVNNGDMPYENNSTIAALPIGSTGQVLTVQSTGLPGWSAPATTVPVGGIIMYFGSYGSWPSSFALCDGQTHSGTLTPNLQGEYIVGAGNNSPAATNGMGIILPGTGLGDSGQGAGIGTGHTYNIPTPVVGASPNGGNNNTVSQPGATVTVTPPYAAVYMIMRVQ